MKRIYRRYVKALFICLASLAGLVTVNILQTPTTGFQSEDQFSNTNDLHQIAVQTSSDISTANSANSSSPHHFADLPALRKGPEEESAIPKKVRIVSKWKNKKSKNQSADSSDVYLRLGYPRSKFGFLTIGLTTVPRIGASYLLETLGSLLEAMTEIEKTEVVIVIFLASLNETWVTETIHHIEAPFYEHIENGLILAIQPKEQLYPDFREITKTNFNDPLARVHWRTKQNIDYAYLFSYCKNISQYYIHVEDDVTTANNFISDIKNYIFQYEQRTWFCIDFSSLGFIGKLFQSQSLQLLSDYLLMFREEMPCDLLLNHLKQIMMPDKSFRSTRSLFQHRGVISSLENKTQLLIDRRFKDTSKLFLHGKNFKKRRIVNPTATLSTSMSQYNFFSPDKAYIFSEADYFWAKSPTRGSYYTMEFDKPVNLTHIFVQTGHPDRGIDKLEKGEIKLGLPIGQNKCGKFVTIATFVHGVVDINTWQSSFPYNINCVSIIVLEDQSDWLIINEISLY